MSQALERLLPDLLRHLSADSMLIKDNDNDEGDGKFMDDGGGGDVGSSSAHRWRRCIELWRHLLGSDRLFLALLFHSGSLWATEWSPPEELSSATIARTEARGRRSWSQALMWFLQICEVSSADANDNSDGHGGNGGGAESTSHIYADDEAEVQRVAMRLLSDWFALVDRCGKRFARAYYFSCALKVAALVGNTALVEDIPHLHDLVMREPRSASQFTAFCSILCCLLVEEARQEHSFRLKLPPPFFLLNFNVIGRGSRIGVWLPRAVADGNRRADLADARTSTNRSAVSGSAPNGEFHSCDVCSPGVMLCTSSSSSSKTAGDLMLGVQLLDEAYVQTIDVLPLMNGDGRGSQDHAAIGEKRRGRGTRSSSSFSSAVEMEPSPPRCWYAFCPSTQSYVRVDLLRPRNLHAVVPSSSPSSTSAVVGGGGRRRGSQQAQEMSANIAPLRRSSRITAQRDPLATIVFALATTARRLMGCRGLFVQKQRHQEQDALSGTNNNNKGGTHGEDGNTKYAAGEEEEKCTTHLQRDDRATRRSTRGGSSNARPTAVGHSRTPGATVFPTAEEELECLIECALHLFLEALLLCLALSSDVMPQLDAWTVEVTSNAVDLALATTQPVVRHMHAVGYALCIAPQPHQSLLVTVGLFATLARRQLENSGANSQNGKKKSGNNDTAVAAVASGGGGGGFTGWWGVFKACVLKDAVIPGQLCGGTWELVERVERFLCTAQHVRLQKQQRSSQLLSSKREQEESSAEDRNTRHATTAAAGADDVADTSEVVVGENTGPHRRLLLPSFRMCRQQENPAKKCRGELQAPLASLRAGRVVEVGSGQQSQHALSLNDVMMSLWYALDRAAADAA